MNAPIDISNVRLETERLILRPWRDSDLDDFYAYASVPGVGEAAGWPHHESMETSRKILADFVAHKQVLAITEKTTGRAIGSVGLHESWAAEEPDWKACSVREIGYVLSKDFWGRGLMTEAVGAVIHWCFSERQLDALTVGHFPGNAKSRRVIEKCGFRYVKTGVFHAKQLARDFEEMQYILVNPANGEQ